ncbi:MAG TPA: CBS domain-containing protein [Sedimenticola sp.]|nr:CBS domain-containing protein [Sedimenticola sp.]
MYVSQIMSTEVDTATPEMKLSHAANLMREKRRRFLPVVDEENHLVGLFSHKELARAAPSDITTLTVGEVNYLTSRITVGQIMQKEPLSCGPGTLVEEAGMLMRTHKVGCLPVLYRDKVVGVVTEDDILDFLLDITGCYLQDTARIAVHLPDETGTLAELLNRINAFGGYIATVVSPVSRDETGKRIAIVRYRSDNPESLDDHLESLGYDLITEELPGAD